MSASFGIDRWHRGVPSDVRLPTIAGVAILILCLGGFGGWAALAPLEGAVVVSGSFVATGQNKLVQHLEGGILREMLVSEGDLVEAGQPLLRLDDTAANAKLQRLASRYRRLMLMKARLEAEIEGNTSFSIPPALVDAPEVADIHARQSIELRARRAKLDTEVEVLKKEIAGLEESVRGFEAQAKATEGRLALFREELKDKNALLERQLVRKSEVLALQRAEAELFGELGEIAARSADARERIARAYQQIAQIRSATAQKTIEELRQTETELDDIEEQLRAARDVVERVEVRSPVRGIVVKLNQNTPGGVIGAGAVILELVPVNDDLVIEAHLDPSEIAHVKEGQRALVRLAALNQRVTPMIAARTVYLSADAVATQIAGRADNTVNLKQRPYYIVRVRLDDQDVKAKLGDFRPTPGMPADVFINTGERTFFNYIMRPIWDSFSRAFREQ
ncbi:MAG TPA: HlyD family type I secretion periplasmic adaptor subunit [Hyphomicrobiaceae bacterium]|nr:HlyD family type I secretion periplasmic adaptor subunit [Hyphomicrobiaceae bacterium]